MLSIETMSSSSSSMSKKEYGVVDLPAEVLYEIFSRLPSLKPVHKLRCVSKLWNSVLSEPSFVNKIYNSLNIGTPWIFMYDPTDHQDQIYLNDYHRFITHHDGLSFKFLLDSHPIKKRNLDKVYFWDSCSNGLVLYSAAHELDNNAEFCVCNPLTKQWVALPHRPFGPEQRAKIIKLVCDTSTGHSVCNYKVVVLCTAKLVYDDNRVWLQMFSSDTGEWKMLPTPVEMEDASKLCGRYWKDFCEMVIHRGFLYWTRKGKVNEIVAYSTLESNENGVDRRRSIGFPPLGDETYVMEHRRVFGESEGSIYCGCIEQEYDYKAFLSVWMLEDDYTNGGLNWRLVHNNIELKGYKSTYLEVIYFNPVDRNVIIIVDRGCCLAYNIKTLTYEVLRGCPIPINLKEFELRPILITPKPTMIEEISNSSVLQAHNDQVQTDTSSSKGSSVENGKSL